MKALIAVMILATACLADAQIPDIKVQLDATISFVALPNARPLFNAYSLMGRPSTIALSTYTEQGFRVYIAEKLEHIPGDLSSDLFDQYYIEDEGSWRIGKQYLPFGSGLILHDSAVAARGDTSLVFERIPISFAICDAGQGLDSGAIGRIGSAVGFSAAVGHNFGTAGTSLDDVRRPEDAPGPGKGWKDALGVDAAKKLGHWTYKAEMVEFKNGETSLDHDATVLDASVSLDPKRGESATLGWSRVLPTAGNYYRLSGSFAISKNISFEPMIRFRNGSLFDLAAQVRVRI